MRVRMRMRIYSLRKKRAMLSEGLIPCAQLIDLFCCRCKGTHSVFRRN